MSRTKIICSGCGFVQIHCICKKKKITDKDYIKWLCVISETPLNQHFSFMDSVLNNIGYSTLIPAVENINDNVECDYSITDWNNIWLVNSKWGTFPTKKFTRDHYGNSKLEALKHALLYVFNTKKVKAI